MSLDTGRSVASRPRNKVNQALAIAATINSQAEMKSSGAQSAGRSGAGAKGGGGGGGGANSQSQSGQSSGSATTGDDYETSKAADKGGRERRDATAEERRMVVRVFVACVPCHMD